VPTSALPRRNTRTFLHFATKDKDKVLTIIKEVLLNPVLTLRIWKKEKVIGLGWTAKRSPQSVIGYFESILYGDHVYGNIVTGNQSTVSKLTVNDLGLLQNELQSDHAAISKWVISTAKKWKLRWLSCFQNGRNRKEEESPASKRLSSPKKAGYYCK
jgi:hypothetical protein